ncbi:MAG: hypothetical protein Q7S16_03055 [bacterium]|nr:hypothetical protein [bacterium]
MGSLDNERFVDPFDLPEKGNVPWRDQTAEELLSLHQEKRRVERNGVVNVECGCGFDHPLNDDGSVDTHRLICSCGSTHELLVDDAGKLHRNSDHWY